MVRDLFPSVEFQRLGNARARAKREWFFFQIEKLNGVAPRPDGVGLLAKRFLPKRADILRFGACLFTRRDSLTEETSKKLIFFPCLVLFLNDRTLFPVPLCVCARPHDRLLPAQELAFSSPLSFSVQTHPTGDRLSLSGPRVCCDLGAPPPSFACSH